MWERTSELENIIGANKYNLVRNIKQETSKIGNFLKCEDKIEATSLHAIENTWKGTKQLGGPVWNTGRGFIGIGITLRDQHYLE